MADDLRPSAVTEPPAALCLGCGTVAGLPAPAGWVKTRAPSGRVVGAYPACVADRYTIALGPAPGRDPPIDLP